MFAIASGVMRNDLLVFKYSNQHRIAAKKGTLTEMTTRCQSLVTCHSLSLVVTRCHSLSLVVIRCHSLSVSLVCLFIKDPRKTSKDQKKTFVCVLQKECSDEIEIVQGKCGILLQQA